MAMPPTFNCGVCQHARYTPARGMVGCTLLSAMNGVQVLRTVGAELHRVWRGRVHPATYPDSPEAPTDGYADRSVIVPARDRCSQFKARLRVA